MGGGNFSTWVFRFNWDSPNPVCAQTTASTDATQPYNEVNGAQLRASNSDSDVGLLELLNFPTGDVYYAGWDRSETTPTEATGIHHPSGDIKKICREDNALTQVASSGAECWQVADWDQGVTEPGSSGSPLFDQNQRIVGQLFGGSAACNGTTDNDLEDVYGRFGVSWDNGGSASNQLEDWLDPIGSNPITLDGLDPNSAGIALDVGCTGVEEPKGTYCMDSIFTPVIVMRNYGSDTLTSVEIHYGINGALDSVYTWTDTLLPSSNVHVTLPDMWAPDGTHIFTAFSQNPNGSLDSNAVNDTINSDFTIMMNGTDLSLFVQLDCWGSETSWEITDEDDNVLYAGGPYSNDNPDLIDVSFCLGDGCYAFTIFDDWGDGMNGAPSFGGNCSAGVGDYYLEDASQTYFEMEVANGDFGDEMTHIFCVGNVAPAADFYAEYPIVCEGNDLEFIDASGGFPSSHDWTFEGGTPNTSTDEDPIIEYATPGTYDVTLIVNNAHGADTAVYEDYITVVANDLGITGTVSPEINGGGDGSISLDISGGTSPYYYEWDNGDSTENIMNLSAGTYEVEVFDDNGCDAFETFTVTDSIVSGITGIRQIKNWSVYPNPSTGLVHVELNLHASKDIQIALYNATGQKLIAQEAKNVDKNIFTFDLEDYSDGFYFIKVFVENQVLARKLIKS